MDKQRVKIRLRPPLGFIHVTTPSISIILHSGETVEVDKDVYERKLKKYADIVPSREKKSEKKTESFSFKEDEK